MKKRLYAALNYADMVPPVLINRLGLEKRTKYLFEDADTILTALEKDASVTTREAAWPRLRQLGLDDFGYVLWSMPNPRYPKLSRLLPKMASPAAQRLWTGNTGVVLLRQGMSFVRAIAYNNRRFGGRPIEDARVLDFGCGYGRIARLMYYFVNEANFFGVDPWDESMKECELAGLTRNFLLSDYLPRDLPLGDGKFDIVYAYSVFTHLSERAAIAALRVLRRYIEPNGLLTITIRPIEFWRFAHYVPPVETLELERSHRSRGFAFRPHSRQSVDGDITYGDTSMTLEWLQAHAAGWQIREHERRLDDRMQTYVFLTPTP